MSRIFDALRQVDVARAGAHATAAAPLGADGLQVVTVTSNKGGVGKTTLATNLAVYLRALDEDLPILVLTLDDQPAIDRMFALDGRRAAPGIAEALREGTLAPAIRFGQYGVHYVPSSREVSELKRTLGAEDALRRALLGTGWRGLVVVDTKSDLEALTRSAIAAADLALVLVKDQVSVLEAERVFALLDGWGRPREHARVVLSLVEQRIRYRDGDARDVLAVLGEELRRRGLPRFETFLSRSPKVESLYTNPAGQALSILHGAAGTPVHAQMHRLAQEVRSALVALRARDEAKTAPAAPPDAADARVDGQHGVARLKRWLLQGGRFEP